MQKKPDLTKLRKRGNAIGPDYPYNVVTERR